MSYGSDIVDGLAELRGYAEERMRATCVIARPAAGGETIDDDGVVTTPTTPVYSGFCSVRFPERALAHITDSAGATIVTARPVVKIPASAEPPRVGDQVTISADPDNPHLAGSVLRIEVLDSQSQATSLRLTCTIIQAGVEQ